MTASARSRVIATKAPGPRRGFRHPVSMTAALLLCTRTMGARQDRRLRRCLGPHRREDREGWKADILRRGRHVSNVPTEVSRIDIINVGVEAFTSEGPSVENWQVFLASRASHSTTKPYQIARLTPIQRTTTCTFANVDVCFPQAGAGEQEGKTMTGSEAVSAKPSIIGWAGSTASPRCLRI